MKLIITESQLKRLVNEQFDDRESMFRQIYTTQKPTSENIKDLIKEITDFLMFINSPSDSGRDVFMFNSIFGEKFNEILGMIENLTNMFDEFIKPNVHTGRSEIYGNPQYVMDISLVNGILKKYLKNLQNIYITSKNNITASTKMSIKKELIEFLKTIDEFGVSFKEANKVFDKMLNPDRDFDPSDN